ncbi:MAG: triose-phosphate isomerase [Bacteroidota bacterium]
MRKKVVAGNWKMNTTVDQGIGLAIKIKSLKLNSDAELIIIPPFTHLTILSELLDDSHIQLGAQNCSDKSNGAYTGEVSADMLTSDGVRYVIIGHSERRAYYNETNSILKDKVDVALKSGLKPIFCCGEILSERESDKHFEVVKNQLNESVFHLEETEFQNIMIAYEPVWAIGTGKTASPEQAEEMHKFIRSLIKERYSESTSDSVSILYGGSCKPSNAREIFSQPNVDGGLIGGASLIAEDFITIANSF